MSKNEITELLESALSSIDEAVSALESAQQLMKDESYGYNITGNMDGYVINYLTKGHDSIQSKIEAYIRETNELEEPDELDTDGDEEDGKDGYENEQDDSSKD